MDTSLRSLPIARISKGDLFRWTDGAKYVLDTQGLELKHVPGDVHIVTCTVFELESVIENHPYNYTSFYIAAPIEAVVHLMDRFSSDIALLMP